ncbi:MAG TPA: HAMP domain-containing sensor histidine kinase, partial [Gemmatimonadales bacterium]|nr:HAMP domain-containing sensor histidine kinase [Gemmatimonadales bacterium]
MNARFRNARPRGLFVAVLLLLTLALAGVLAWEAHRTFRDHQATAERVLHDDTRLAAARFGMRVSMYLYNSAFMPVIDALMHAKAGDPGTALPSPAELAVGIGSHAAEFLQSARYSFRYDLRTGRLETAGGHPSHAARRWLLDTLPLHSRTVYDTAEGLAAIVRTVDGMSRAIVYTVAKEEKGAPRIVVGVEGDPRTFTSVYTMGQEKNPLVPPMLARGNFHDSLVSRIVTDADGVELYRSPAQYEAYTARDSVGAIEGGMRVQVALRPDMAPKLVIGGMPRSPLPLVMTVLVLTAVLIVAALLLLRRDYELSRLRSDFVSGVSHELRTPLAQIRMFSETLLLGRVRSDEERVRSLEIIDQEARRLTHLVENLLHFSRSERQVTRLSPVPAPLAGLVSEAVEAFAPLAAARGVTLRTHLADCVVAAVDADALRQMLLNLLDNAVKYGPPGQTVTIGLTADAARARIWVDDEGPGIPEADRERVWQRFCRLERDRGSAAAGTGIGLSVVRELVALHGGRAWVEDAAARAGG